MTRKKLMNGYKTYYIAATMKVDKAWIGKGMTVKAIRERVYELLSEDVFPYSPRAEVTIEYVEVRTKR